MKSGKYFFRGIIHTVTGLHIGGNQDVSDIGSVDLLVIRDPLSREPYLPGSSLKGKLRSLLEKYHFALDPSFFDDAKMRKMPTGGIEVRHHECGNATCHVCRLFGFIREKDRNIDNNSPARLYVRDAHLTSESREKLEQIDTGYFLSEVKFENTLDRITSAANPRQIERVPRGSEFHFQMVYNLWDQDHRKEIDEDIQSVLIALQLLQDDYIGGHGSRGYGQIVFRDLSLSYKDFDAYKESRPEQLIAHGGTLADFVQAATSFLKEESA